MFIVTPDEMMERGLKLMGHTSPRRRRLGQKKKRRLFQADFGKAPSVLAVIFDDLQTTNIKEAKITNANDKVLVNFLWTFHWLKAYPTEESLEARTGWLDKTIQKKLKAMINRIAALKALKIVWPKD